VVRRRGPGVSPDRLAPRDIIAVPEEGEQVIRLQEIKDIATFGHFASITGVVSGARS
jgi:hypothetical protein